jgi:hypothetical protein
VHQVVEPPQGNVGELAGLQRADLDLPAEAAGAVDGRQLQRFSGGESLRASS